MKIIVASDTHRRSEYLRELEKVHPDADLYLHCGDFCADFSRYPRWLFVQGNCDSYPAPLERIVPAGSLSILMLHGHTIKKRPLAAEVKKLADEKNCQIALFGHTHVSEVLFSEDGQSLVMNPGAMFRSWDKSGGSYGIITIKKDDAGKPVIRAEIVKREDWPF